MSTVTYEIVEQRIAVVTYQNPPVNALGLEQKKDWIRVLKELENNPEIAVIILRSIGKGFSSGSNVKEFENYDQDSWQDYRAVDCDFMSALRYCKVPLIAAVHGYAIAMGFSIAASCDIVISTPDARFGMPEVKVGVIGGEQYLARLMPDKLAHYMALTGNYVTGQDLFPYGQILKLVPEDQLLDAALEVARDIAKNYIVSVKYTKDLIIRRVPNELISTISSVCSQYSTALIGDKERDRMLSGFGKKD